MIDLLAQTEEEMEAIRTAVVHREGLLMSVFDVLRRVPRRVLMVLKLNDLTRCVPEASSRRSFWYLMRLVTGVSIVHLPLRMRTYVVHKTDAV